MDQLSEESGTRILTARHISPEKALLAQSNAVNTTLLCHTYSIQPHFETYYEGKYSTKPIFFIYNFSKLLQDFRNAHKNKPFVASERSRV